ncbi:MAG: methylase [Clostridiaceae bacterium]|jgi:site-specific DNA-methyltransferase (adenine-specific)|nr:methylase [Clostridiaceae bacterium]
MFIDTFEGFKYIPDSSVDMILTDIPYLISKKTNFQSIKEYTRKTKGEPYKDIMDYGEWDKSFDLDKYISECVRILKNGRSIIVFCSWQQLKEVDDIIKRELGKKTGSSRIGVWEKTNPAPFNMQIMPISAYEFFIWNRKGKNWIFNNQRGVKINKKGKEIRIAERLKYTESIVQGGHKTAKPISIFEDLIKTFTNEGDIVFDGCSGGGVTAISAINTKRNFICFENDEQIFKIAKKNFKKNFKHDFEKYFNEEGN